MFSPSVQQRFADALEALVAGIKKDRSILAAILCGSLSHDTVWEKSDIDLLLVTADDRNATGSDIALNADGVNVHANLLPRAEFRKVVDGSVQNSFFHSLLAKGRLLFTHDDTIADLLSRLHDLGSRDSRLQQLRAAISALPAIDKAHRWLITRGDLDYTALWILYAATPLAYIEVVGAGEIVDREAIPRALALNPSLFTAIYTDLLNVPKTAERVQAALAQIDDYLAARAPVLFAPVLEHLREAGEPRSASELQDFFKRHFDVGSVVIACEYLADRGLIAKVSVPARLTRRSTVDVQELAFFHL
jgi:predicted nucleotidyltransferase